MCTDIERRERADHTPTDHQCRVTRAIRVIRAIRVTLLVITVVISLVTEISGVRIRVRRVIRIIRVIRVIGDDGQRVYDNSSCRAMGTIRANRYIGVEEVDLCGIVEHEIQRCDSVERHGVAVLLAYTSCPYTYIHAYIYI